jgi:hypothetical protein
MISRSEIREESGKSDIQAEIQSKMKSKIGEALVFFGRIWES